MLCAYTLLLFWSIMLLFWSILFGASTNEQCELNVSYREFYDLLEAPRSVKSIIL